MTVQHHKIGGIGDLNIGKINSSAPHRADGYINRAPINFLLFFARSIDYSITNNKSMLLLLLLLVRNTCPAKINLVKSKWGEENRRFYGRYS